MREVPSPHSAPRAATGTPLLGEVAAAEGPAADSPSLQGKALTMASRCCELPADSWVVGVACQDRYSASATGWNAGSRAGPWGRGGVARAELGRVKYLLLRRPEAVKLMRVDCAQDPEASARFGAEARYAARLCH